MFRYKRFPHGKGYHDKFDFIPYKKQIVFQEPLPALPPPPVHEKFVIKIRYGIEFTIFLAIEEHTNWEWFVQNLLKLSKLQESELKIRLYHNMNRIYNQDQEQIDLRRPFFFDILSTVVELRPYREEIGERHENEYKTNLYENLWIRPFVSDLVKFFINNETGLRYRDPINIRENMFGSEDIYNSLNLLIRD